MFTFVHKPRCSLMLFPSFWISETWSNLNTVGGSDAVRPLGTGLAIAEMLSRNKSSVCNNSMTDILINGMSIDEPYELTLELLTEWTMVRM